MDGLVAQELVVRRGDTFVVVDPAAALASLYLRRAAAVADLRRRLMALAARTTKAAVRRKPGNLVRILSDPPAIVRAWTALHRTARWEIRACDRPPYVVNPVGPHAVWSDLLDRGVTYRMVVDRRAVDVSGRLDALLRDVRSGEQVRVGDVPLKLMLTDLPAALVGIMTPLRVVAVAIIREPNLLAALSEVFDMVWARSVPLTTYAAESGPVGAPVAPGPDRLVPPSAAEREVLMRLVSGFSAPEIAIRLGWTERVVRHHIDRMKSRLGAATLYQTGYLAVRAGWLDPAQIEMEAPGRDEPGRAPSDGVTA